MAQAGQIFACSKNRSHIPRQAGAKNALLESFEIYIHANIPIFYQKRWLSQESHAVDILGGTPLGDLCQVLVLILFAGEAKTML
jgi:hypothetical protein